MRLRDIVLEAGLISRPRELRRIFLHELFHFVWLRAGNGMRRSFEVLLARELEQGARGELGWSAEQRKRSLSQADPRRRTRRWREYACESFCDSAACIYSGSARHSEYTLAARFRERRRVWFRTEFAKTEISI